jgi:hypothetical protein
VDPAQIDGHGALWGHRLGLVADVERVAAQQLNLFTRTHGDRGGQIAVPPVVAHPRVAVEYPFAGRRHHRVGDAGPGDLDGPEAASGS